MTKQPFSFPFRHHALALAMAMAAGYSHAATLNVSDSCTLVNAINNANTDTDTDGAGGCPSGSGADQLNLSAKATYTLTAINNINAGPNGLPLITSVITINGNGASIKRANAADTESFRLLRIVNGALTLNNVRLSGGKLTGDTDYGGGISNNGTLTLNNSTISGNSALGINSAGSGILNGYAGVLSLNNSTVSGNSATHGGAIFDVGGTAELNNSTISGNRAIGDTGGTGGIINLGNMQLINSTVSGNSSISASSYGTGGIQNSGTMSLLHSTVANNLIAHGNVTGINNSRTLTLTNSLIANSKGGSDCYSGNFEHSAMITLRGTNLIEDGTCGTPPSADPKLAPLLDNGGVTLTHALRLGSPAADIVDTRCSSTDQRNVKRPQPAGSLCDAGSFERIKTKPASTKIILNFFDAQLSGGGLLGTGSEKFAYHSPNALRNQLLTAGDYRDRNLTIRACEQLARTLLRIDTDNTPDNNDYVTGSQANMLAANINALRSNWTCTN
ncbi:MAG: choice-of-anchor Q domain-containing protein [Methylovulum sp.]|nr:choice-of-anchor Q domain-containing protein [Methylovulum sp.]